MSIYFLLLLIVFFLLYEGIISSLIYAPKKIKIISLIALILMTFRYIALIILSVIKNQNYLYLLKPLVFTNLLSIPICGVISVFIFARNNKIKLKKILFICLMLSVVYCIMIYKSASDINVSILCGYIIELQLEGYCYIGLLIINSVFIIKGIELFNKTYSNKLGSAIIIISSIVTIISVILTSINGNLPWLLLGDISWIITIDYGLIKFKK
ncbi:hypothetical protein KPL35_01660 [Clostridium sp. CF011]|nr:MULTISPECIES: hypothetical protein [unclassified Clostridium]MBU3090798.1 hypothetical protein [Clostridium sp. CF011]MBW9144637.1 hypothetical protein [Clostridium sp. CM027]UVE40608.1 hypothetical protein KTC92_16055 [Clostridium sp. CM027]WAG69574.1 hypothetical protein LL036_16515 [Clostridium sp. CF011]